MIVQPWRFEIGRLNDIAPYDNILCALKYLFAHLNHKKNSSNWAEKYIVKMSKKNVQIIKNYSSNEQNNSTCMSKKIV